MINRRNFITLTAGGLIHLTGQTQGQIFGRQDSELLIREAASRGHTDLGWLDSYHSFSFGRYFNPEHMNFRSLAVINDDKVAPGRGFPTHPHRNMEIISYVLDGALEHRDSTGTGSIIAPDEIQYMSAGRGITHSEFNPSETALSHFLQIWIKPARKGGKPRYEQNPVEAGSVDGRLGLLLSGNERLPGITINQDARVYAAKLDGADSVEYTVNRGRHGWLQVARGSLSVNGTRLQTGDAVATSRPTRLALDQANRAEILLFDLS